MRTFFITIFLGLYVCSVKAQKNHPGFVGVYRIPARQMHNVELLGGYQYTERYTHGWSVTGAYALQMNRLSLPKRFKTRFGLTYGVDEANYPHVEAEDELWANPNAIPIVNAAITFPHYRRFEYLRLSVELGYTFRLDLNNCISVNAGLVDQFSIKKTEHGTIVYPPANDTSLINQIMSYSLNSHVRKISLLSALSCEFTHEFKGDWGIQFAVQLLFDPREGSAIFGTKLGVKRYLYALF